MDARKFGSSHASPNLLTAIPGVALRPLAAKDAPLLYDLVSRSQAHLTQYGDYQELVELSLAEIQSSLSAPPGESLRMGIWRGAELIGRVDLNPVAPGVYVLGYWLGAAYTGHGYMTAACRTLMDYASQTRAVREFWTGVRQANRKSAAVVERLGFTIYEELPDHIRYRLVLVQE